MNNDIIEVTQSVLAERQNRDRGWWRAWEDGFTSDAFINMSWINDTAAEFVRRTKALSTDKIWGHHRLSPPTVRVNGNRAIAELPLGIEFRILVEDVEADLASFCRSQYRLEKQDGVWKIAGITSIYEYDTITPALPGEHLAIKAHDLKQYRPSYRCLAWYLAKQGNPLTRELPGDDRPDLSRPIYQAEWAWLNGDNN